MEISKNSFNLLKNRYFKAGATISPILFSGKILSFIWKILLLEKSVELVGKTEVLLTSLGLVTSFVTLALPAAFSRFSLKKATKTVSYFVFSIIQSLKLFSIITLVGLVIIFLLPDSLGELLVVPIHIFLITVLCLAFQEFLLVFLNIKKNFFLYGLSKYFWVPLIKVAALVAIINKQFTHETVFFQIVISFAITTVITLLSLLTKVKKINFFKVSEKNKLTIKEKNNFLSYSTLLNGSLVTYIIYGSIDVYLINYLMGSFFVGIYSAIFMGINLVELTLSPFLQTFQVHLAEKKSTKQKIKFTKKIAILLLKIGFLVSILLTPIILVFVKNIIEINFSLIITTFNFSLAKVIDTSLVQILRLYLDYQGNQKFTFKTMIYSLLLKAIAGTTLIYFFGLIGLAFASLVTEIKHGILVWKKMFKNTNQLKNQKLI
jgi:O-antigen/teichoic acid export membrane protein